ncbi:hypothetical protein RFI_39882 [Reticulomyxa filosa]|nr:hypothetical protein RFI_39882 [Reticulomyxa filosa]|eukprot:ETN97647.1 hypothetical protein RFI_39882 [Reticulomyxa filosa]
MTDEDLYDYAKRMDAMILSEFDQEVQEMTDRLHSFAKKMSQTNSEQKLTHEYIFPYQIKKNKPTDDMTSWWIMGNPQTSHAVRGTAKRSSYFNVNAEYVTLICSCHFNALWNLCKHNYKQINSEMVKSFLFELFSLPKSHVIEAMALPVKRLSTDENSVLLVSPVGKGWERIPGCHEYLEECQWYLDASSCLFLYGKQRQALELFVHGTFRAVPDVSRSIVTRTLTRTNVKRITSSNKFIKKKKKKLTKINY